MTLTEKQTNYDAASVSPQEWMRGVPHMVGIFQVNGDPVNRDELYRLRCEIEDESLVMTNVGDPATGFAAIVGAGFHGPSFAEHRQASGNGASREKTFWCVCDGRIDNPEDLLPAFQSAGIRLQDHSAAEMVLAAYRLWGTECPIRLIGDYSFAVWDPEQRQLFCARDPLLLKTFYYTFDGKRFAFASDPRTLIKAFSLSSKFDNIYLSTYMVKYTMNWERTPWEQTKQVPGGCALLVSRNGLKEWRWWDLKEKEAGSLRYKKREQYYEHIRDLMDKAVGARMRNAGDGPISIALSRGIDSSAIAATALNLWRSGAVDCGGVQGITMPALSHPEADESKDAAVIARHLGLPQILAEERSFTGDLRAISRYNAEPYPMQAKWDLWDGIRIACVNSGSKVLMTGIGGGENFSASPSSLSKLAHERRWLLLAREVGDWLSNGNSLSQVGERLMYGLRHWDQNRSDAETLAYRPWIKHQENCVLSLGFRFPAHPALRGFAVLFLEHGVRSSWFERSLFLPSGIELRDPLYDRRFLEFSWALPIRWKVWSEMNKPTFRRAFASEIPLDMAKSNAKYAKHWGKSISEGTQILGDILDNSSDRLVEVIDVDALRDNLYRVGSATETTDNYYAYTAYQIACWVTAQEDLARGIA